MKKQLEQVKEFHDKFQQSYSTFPTSLKRSEYELRYKLAVEEIDEYLDAADDGDVIEVLDALADQLYILLGTVFKHGLQDYLEAAFDLVHANNMNKLDENGKPILREDGKILKPANFKKVELKELFTNLK